MSSRELIDKLEAGNSLADLKRMAVEKGVSPAGTKRDIARRIYGAMSKHTTRELIEEPRGAKGEHVKTYVVTIPVSYRQTSTSSGRRYIRSRMTEMKRRILEIDPEAGVKPGRVIGTIDVKTSRLLTAKMIDKRPWFGAIEVRDLGSHGSVPMVIRGQHGDRRTAFYIQYWSPKSDPEISQPYYHSGPEEGTFKNLDQALRAARQLLQQRSDAFQVDIYSQDEKWVPEAEEFEEDPRYGYWEIIEGTVKGYDLQGKLIYDETDPDYAPMTNPVNVDDLFSEYQQPLPPEAY